MIQQEEINRRQFMKLSALIGGSVVFGFSTKSFSKASRQTITAPSMELDALIKIAPDNTITLILNRIEMGQGVITGLPMLIAEELDADWEKVVVERAAVDSNKYGNQTTTASISIFSGWDFCRLAGAKVRTMLVASAAERWGVSIADCSTRKSFVHGPNNQALAFSELAHEALKQSIPQNLILKSPEDYTLIGRSVSSKSSTSIVTGKSQYGVDVQVPDMLSAYVIKPPAIGQKVSNWQPKSLPEIEAIVRIDDGLVIIAENFWLAKNAAKKIQVEWSDSKHLKLSSAALIDTFNANLKLPGHTVVDIGEAGKNIASGKRVIEQDYHVPFMAHATLEPVNATAHVKVDSCTIWAPTQAPDKVKKDISDLLGLPLESVEVIVTMVGGGFGRKSYRDFVVDAVQASLAIGRPVKLIRTRESDIQQDLYRPAYAMQLIASLNQSGFPNAMHVRASGPSVREYYPYPKTNKVSGQADGLSIAGISENPYGLAHYLADAHTISTPIPVGILRSIAHSYTCYARECFIDELAAQFKHDPMQYRLTMLADNPRAYAVMKLAAEKSNWFSPPAKGRFRGCALFVEEHKDFDYFVYNAQVVELSIEDQGIKIHSVVSVGDFGTIVNPDGVKSQLEGGVIFGMGLTLYDQIDIVAGKVLQSNFHDYRLPRISDAPDIKTFLIDSSKRPAGVGEKGVPAVIPAICNAIYSATGRMHRQLPIGNKR